MGRKRDETQERRQIEKQEQTLFPIIAKKETKLFKKEVFLLNTFRFPGTNDNIISSIKVFLISLVPVSPGVVNQLTPDITDMASNHLSKTRPFLPLLYEIPEFWVRIDSIQLKEKVSVFMR